MARGPIEVPSTKIVQPSGTDTKKAQKRYQQGDLYNPLPLNAELDFIHERLNKIVIEAPAVTDLESTAVLADVITRLNALTEILRSAGLLRRE